MINNNIISRIKDKGNGELSIIELKELYRTDALLYPTLVDTIYYLRNIYKDLVKLYGKEYVACTPNELNENTICYIGELYIKKNIYI